MFSAGRKIFLETVPRNVIKVVNKPSNLGQRAVQAVNTTLIELYWQVGQTISRTIGQAQWGDGVVAQLSGHPARTQPGLRGFTTRNLFRMRQFYEAYRDDEKVASLARQFPWMHNLIILILILNQSRRLEEREFYLCQAIREKWSKRELERQFKTALFERTVLNPVKVTPLVSQAQPYALSVFKDSYRVDFLDLPQDHRGAAVRQQGRGSCGIRAQPKPVPGADCRLPDAAARQGTACQAKLHELYAQNAAADTAEGLSGEASH